MKLRKLFIITFLALAVCNDDADEYAEKITALSIPVWYDANHINKTDPDY